MSRNQLLALKVLAGSKKGVVEAAEAAGSLGLEGKALGGVFSSLARQKVNGEPLVVPWGRGGQGRGLRWRLSEAVASSQELLPLLKELLGGWEK